VQSFMRAPVELADDMVGGFSPFPLAVPAFGLCSMCMPFVELVLYRLFDGVAGSCLVLSCCAWAVVGVR